MSKFVYPDVTSEVREKFSAQDAEELLVKNTHNRPRSSGLTTRYRWKMIKKRWLMNGEPIIISRTGQLMSGQHRCEALIAAESMRKRKPKYFKERYGWNGPITIPVILVFGIHDDYANTLDQGKTRTHSDILFRMSMFDQYVDANDKALFNMSDKKKLARDLATAIRTVWLRLEGKRVKDAPKFDESEMLEFLEYHPKIVDAVVHVYNEDAGKEKRTSSIVSRAYLAAVMYLAGTSTTDRVEWVKGEAEISTELWEQAEDFVVQFSQGTDLSEGDPALILRRIFDKQRSAGTTRDRDVILNTLVKAFDAMIEEKSGLTAKDLTPKKDEQVRLGGLDVDFEELEEEILEDEEEPVEEEPKPAKAKAKPAKKASAKKKPAKKKKPVTVPADEEVEDDDIPELDDSIPEDE